MLRLSLISLAFAVVPAGLPAQNLVPNPSFEGYSTCPTTIGQTVYCNSWSSPTTGTPDYFNSCHTGPIVGVPTNVWGSQAAHSGNAYASCIVFINAGGYVGEYLEVPLSSTLIAGQTYDVSFWVSLTDKSRWAIAEIGAYLSIGSVTTSGGTTPLPYTPQIENVSTNILTNKTGWVQIAGTFTAAGGESHLVLGCFKAGTALAKQNVGGLSDWANYYIDDVEVSLPGGGGGGGVTTPHLIGWSDMPLPATSGYLDIQDVNSNCQPATTRCRTLSLQVAATPYAGGTAYDARYRSVWASDGLLLAEFLLDPHLACATRCKPFKATLIHAQARVSGLAHSERRAQLFQLATAPGAAELTIYDNRGTCPGRSSTCRIPLPANALAAGLAHDEVTDQLFFAVSSPLAGGGWTTEIWVSAAASPCKILCRRQLFGCSKRLVTGLAYESCKNLLYATDGQITQTFGVVNASACSFKIGSCCKKQLTPTYRGLAVIPGWKKLVIGKPCAISPCARCSKMSIGCQGDPSLGNTFKVKLSNAPSGVPAWLFGRVGACGPGTPLPFPLCGRLYGDPSQILFPPLTTTGLASCDGYAEWNLPIPATPQLCGLKLCLQWFFVCSSATGNTGMGLSRAIEFPITGG